MSVKHFCDRCEAEITETLTPVLQILKGQGSVVYRAELCSDCIDDHVNFVNGGMRLASTRKVEVK